MKWLILMVAIGCGKGSTSATTVDAPPIIGDSTIDVDAAPTDGHRWRLEERPASALAPLGNTTINVAGPGVSRPARVTIVTQLGGCEDMAMPRYDWNGTNTVLTIVPRVWVPVGTTCTLGDRSVTRPFVVGIGPGDTTIAALGTTDTVHYTVTATPTDCVPGRSPCAADCDCTNGQRCLPTDDPQLPAACATPCELTRDCEGGTCLPSGGTLPWTCTATPAECTDDSSCPIGWRCNTGRCIPNFVLKADIRHLCTSDSECLPGLRCVEADDAVTPPRCQAVCKTNGPWCSGQHLCFERYMDVSGYAGAGSECGWIGE